MTVRELMLEWLSYDAGSLDQEVRVRLVTRNPDTRSVVSEKVVRVRRAVGSLLLIEKDDLDRAEEAVV